MQHSAGYRLDVEAGIRRDIIFAKHIHVFAFTAFVLLAIVPLAAFAHGVMLTDDLGRRIVLPQPPARIISLSPSATETLFAVGAGPKLVADSTYCNYPPQALKLPHLNGLSPSLEVVVSLRPDIILISDQTMTRARADQMATHLRCPVYVTNAADYAAVEKDILSMGAAFGTTAKARELVASMESVRRAVIKAVSSRKRPKVFVVVWVKPLMTAGGRTFISDLIGLAGGINVAEGASQYAVYSEEKLVADSPDVILASDQPGDRDATITALAPLSLRSVVSGRVACYSDDLTVRPGPRLSLGLLAMAKILHPEAKLP